MSQFITVDLMILIEKFPLNRHGGYGYQSSWGSVTMALELLEDAWNGNYRAALPEIAGLSGEGQVHY